VDVRSPADGWTPLLAAVDLGSSQLVSTLLKLGARLSADRLLGFTPLHLACQMGHWHLVPSLVEAMQGQYARVAAWGPSPQYVSLNLADAYGRTALDIALLRYFASPLPSSRDGTCESFSIVGGPSPGKERQKAVDVLREFVHRRPSDDPGVVCGWELLHVLNLLDTIPSRKALGVAAPEGDGAIPRAPSAASREEPYGDIEEMLQAVRKLVRAGAQTRWFHQELIQPPARTGGGSESIAADLKESRMQGPRFSKFSPVDVEDMDDQSEGEIPV
ncbi:unnamed protein product, partial [Polarella glacialis]